MTLTLGAETTPPTVDTPDLTLRARVNELLHHRGWSPRGSDTARLLQQIEHIRLGSMPVLPDWRQIDPAWYWKHSLAGSERHESAAVAPTYVTVHEDKGLIEVAYAFPATVAVDTWCDDHRPVEMNLPLTKVGVAALAQLAPVIEAYALDSQLVAACVAGGTGCGTFNLFAP
ncbi:hypothetical protein ACFYN3_39435 [Streptomyces lavendulae]|uniref:hypothetical protein n=1 Tax=Streptomyces lavendulae TaxID=1914 RepID=UPI0036CE218C